MLTENLKSPYDCFIWKFAAWPLSPSLWNLLLNRAHSSLDDVLERMLHAVPGDEEIQEEPQGHTLGWADNFYLCSRVYFVCCVQICGGLFRKWAETPWGVECQGTCLETWMWTLLLNWEGKECFVNTTSCRWKANTSTALKGSAWSSQKSEIIWQNGGIFWDRENVHLENRVMKALYKEEFVKMVVLSWQCIRKFEEHGRSHLNIILRKIVISQITVFLLGTKDQSPVTEQLHSECS